MSNFKTDEKRKQEALITNSNLFDGDKGFGYFVGKQWPFVLKDGLKNLYTSIRSDVIEYFKVNNISWWKGTYPSGHILSSQIACLNHLFAIRNNKKAVLAILNGVRNEFTDVLPVSCDVTPHAYISFEVISLQDHLNERQSTRGSNCTSIDAFIYAKHKSGKLWLIPIEWKYTEAYPDQDKSKENKEGKYNSGVRRIDRYKDLITISKQLKTLDEYQGSIYFQEPFYQLMRQTLWAEKIVLHKATELLKADDYLHLHIIPRNNKNLLNKIYKVSGKDMETTWRTMLIDQSKYIIVDPQIFLQPITDSYSELCSYLRSRYW